MTLRDSAHESTNKKYSVSHSGKHKSRLKIRPALSVDLFRSDPIRIGSTNTVNQNQSAEVPVSSTTAENRTDKPNSVGTNNTSSRQDPMESPAQHHNHHLRNHSKGVIETAL
ncbi:uncharacterized protein LOC131425656 [Malaya genurostris]|uniref:uncharacterized protein LOC131425656 n=1 Tax=Malaya genurostris TaxID=325434 RepID=UPI0026F387A8|nr:uncharacterized protein LOC131425656 [Malaya genurostris]